MKPSKNQKLNFTKNFNELTPRSKAMFSAMLNQEKKTTKIKNNGTKIINFQKKELENTYTNNDTIIGLLDSQIKNDKIVPKLADKEIHEFLILEKKEKSSLILNEKQIIDLISVKINPKSPRTRQSLINLSYDPEFFSHFSFEEMYNPNIGRSANIKKYIEYLCLKAHDFNSVLDERQRLVRLERDLNKKLINENNLSSNFAQSIFKVTENKSRKSKTEIDDLYYNYYLSPASRKRLNISQMEFDTKLLENRKKFTNFKSKIDSMYNNFQESKNHQTKYYSSFVKKIENIENNKNTYLSKIQSKAQEISQKLEIKKSHINHIKNNYLEDLQIKFDNIRNNDSEIFESKEKASQKRLLEIQKKDKNNEKLLEKKKLLKENEKKQENENIALKLKEIEEKNKLTEERRNKQLENVKNKLMGIDSKINDYIHKVKKAEEGKEQEIIKGFINNFQNKFEISEKKRKNLIQTKKNEIKNKEKEKLKEILYNKSKLKQLELKETAEIEDKLSEDDKKSDNSAKLRRSSSIEKSKRNKIKEIKMEKNFVIQLKQIDHLKDKLIEKSKEKNYKILQNQKENLYVVIEARNNAIEAKEYKEKLEELLVKD